LNEQETCGLGAAGCMANLDMAMNQVIQRFMQIILVYA
jgi:hypothetical protein